MALNVDPPKGVFPATGGNATFTIVNTTGARMAFKVKTSNNENYRVTPVYGFIEKACDAEMEVIRLQGPAQEDRLVVQWTEANDDNTEPQQPFRENGSVGEEDRLVVQWTEANEDNTEPQQPFRENGSVGEVVLPEDRLVVQWTEANEDNTEPQQPFRENGSVGEVVLPVRAQ